MPEPAGSEAEPLPLRETDVLTRIHLEIQGQGIRRIRLNHFLHKLHVDGVLAEDGVFVHRLKIDCNKNGQGISGSTRLPHLMLKTSGIFKSCIRAFRSIAATRAGVTSGLSL